jgi:hypothetical protein
MRKYKTIRLLLLSSKSLLFLLRVYLYNIIDNQKAAGVNQVWSSASANYVGDYFCPQVAFWLVPMLCKRKFSKKFLINFDNPLLSKRAARSHLIGLKSKTV